MPAPAPQLGLLLPPPFVHALKAPPPLLEQDDYDLNRVPDARTSTRPTPPPFVHALTAPPEGTPFEAADRRAARAPPQQRRLPGVEAPGVAFAPVACPPPLARAPPLPSFPTRGRAPDRVCVYAHRGGGTCTSCSTTPCSACTSRSVLARYSCRRRAATTAAACTCTRTRHTHTHTAHGTRTRTRTCPSAHHAMCPPSTPPLAATAASKPQGDADADPDADADVARARARARRRRRRRRRPSPVATAPVAVPRARTPYPCPCRRCRCRCRRCR